MSVASLPLNLTATLGQGGEQGINPASLLLRPGLRCDLLAGSLLPRGEQAIATQAEVYVVVAGYGGIRCEDGSVMDVTAGDVVYVGPGTSRVFEALSRKFSALRLTF